MHQKCILWISVVVEFFFDNAVYSEKAEEETSYSRIGALCVWEISEGPSGFLSIHKGGNGKCIIQRLSWSSLLSSCAFFVRPAGSQRVTHAPANNNYYYKACYSAERHLSIVYIVFYFESSLQQMQFFLKSMIFHVTLVNLYNLNWLIKWFDMTIFLQRVKVNHRKTSKLSVVSRHCLCHYLTWHLIKTRRTQRIEGTSYSVANWLRLSCKSI